MAAPLLFDATSADMIEVVDNLSTEPRLALDTESDPFHRYREKVCLIQISTASADLLFDPLVGGLPERVAVLLADRSRTMVMHGADYDVRSMRRSFNLIFGKIFDTSIAASLLGKKELGLKALLETELQITIDKSEQRSDWGRRPLTDEQLAYAAADTRHLLPLADKLKEELFTLNRLAWLEEECDELRLREPAERAFDPEGYRSLNGARKLGERGKRALRALFIFREDEAKARDVPPFRVLPNELLVHLAERVDKEGALDAQELARIKRLSGDFSMSIADTIQRGLAVDCERSRPHLRAEPPIGRRPVGLEIELPEGSPRMRGDVEKRVDREKFRARMEKMKKVRSDWSTKLGIAPGFLVSAAILERLAKEPPASIDALRAVRGMTAWRVDTVGEELLAALRN